MNPISKATDVIFFPARTAIAVAGAGLRTTVRVLGWAAEQAGQASGRGTPTVTVPEPRPAEPQVDPMEPTRTPPPTVPASTTPARKVPASEVPLKSAPTPSMPAGVAAIDDALGADEPVLRAEAAAEDRPATKAPATKAPATKAPATKAPATKAPAKKTGAKKAPAKKAAARKAPSKQAAVLAPALGLSEDEVIEVVGDTDEQ